MKKSVTALALLSALTHNSACADGGGRGAAGAKCCCGATPVARELSRIITWRGPPEAILSDNCTELTSNAILA